VSFGILALALIGGIVTVRLTARAFIDPSASMENTIRPGDHLFAAASSQIRRGDVIVAQVPSLGPGYFIKRVIGLPGDHVACCDARGRITVNSKALDETYLYPGDAPSTIRFDVTVPAGKLWLLGDHRIISYDSRVRGPLAVRIVGRVVLVLHSGHHILLQTPSAFVSAGLEPSDDRVPALIIGFDVSFLSFLLILALSIVGVIRFAIRKRRKPRDPAASAAVGSLRAPPGYDG